MGLGLDAVQRAAIDARAQAARASHDPDKEALGKDVQALLDEVDDLSQKQRNLESELSERDEEIACLRGKLE
jgi:peptidoglycan hydrolase CwlO-like protein